MSKSTKPRRKTETERMLASYWSKRVPMGTHYGSFRLGWYAALRSLSRRKRKGRAK